jgi:hypothetical protein
MHKTAATILWNLFSFGQHHESSLSSFSHEFDELPALALELDPTKGIFGIFTLKVGIL